jgi:Protein of unknown function (DUF3108)
MKRLFLLVLSSFFLFVQGVGAEQLSVFDHRQGQRLDYSIDFLWFDSLAEGHLTFNAGADAGTYRAVLEARTLGVAAWLTSNRVQRYVSVMEQTPEGPLRVLSYESQIIKGKGDKRKEYSKRYLFDHDRQQVLYQRATGGVFGKQEVLPMPEGAAPNDILTAFFNFQAGFFGPIVPGVSYRIPTFSKKGTAYIEAETLPGPLKVRPDFFSQDGLLVKVILDPEVFGSSGGVFYFQFNDSFQPVRGIVENVIGAGDVYGTLVNSSQSERSPIPQQKNKEPR